MKKFLLVATALTAVHARVEGRREGQSRRPSWGLAAFGARRKLELAAEGRQASSPTGQPSQACGGRGTARKLRRRRILVVAK
jgi:hypothetical protein